jgi:NIMA (never in mitosis gene a)-related kinase
MSPEIFEGQDKSHESEIWAIGCVLYELCFLNVAFYAESEKIEEITYKVYNEDPDYKNFKYSKELLNLIRSLLIKDKNERYTI